MFEMVVVSVDMAEELEYFVGFLSAADLHELGYHCVATSRATVIKEFFPI